MECVFQMVSPTLRCHHRSGSSKRSRTVRTMRTVRASPSITGKEKTARTMATYLGTLTGATGATAVSHEAVARAGSRRIDVLGRSADQAMQISAGDAEGAGGKCLVAVALTNGLVGQPNFVIAQLIFERCLLRPCPRDFDGLRTGRGRGGGSDGYCRDGKTLFAGGPGVISPASAG